MVAFIFHMVKSPYIKTNCLIKEWSYGLRTQLWISLQIVRPRPFPIRLRGELWFVLLSVSVGYEYESCLDLTLWEKRTAVLQGYELDASNMGGWTLDKHHVLDVQNGKPSLAVNTAHSRAGCPALPCDRFLSREHCRNGSSGKQMIKRAFEAHESLRITVLFLSFQMRPMFIDTVIFPWE